MLTDSSDLLTTQPPSTTGSVADNVADNSDSGHSTEPMTKKMRLDAPRCRRGQSESDRLDERLEKILCCAVCLDLPMTPIFQCKNGHLICSPCLFHLLADYQLKDDEHRCPNCRCKISLDDCVRNLAVEKAVQELPGICRFCGQSLSRANLALHERTCDERLVTCGYERLGCRWTGPFHEKDNHEDVCSHRKKCGREILLAFDLNDQKEREKQAPYNTIFDLLSFDRQISLDLKWSPYRTDEYLPKLYYETTRFTAFNLQWAIKGRINDDQKDPTQSSERRLTYQLVLKSKTNEPIEVFYLIIKGPYGDMKVFPEIYRSEFSDSKGESNYNALPLVDSNECNRLLSGKAIHFRFWIFQVHK